MRPITEFLFFIAISVLLAVFLLNAGCAGSDVLKTKIVVQNCTVVPMPDGFTLINCPDGSKISVPPQVIINTETVEVPVIIEVPQDCGLGHHDNGKHLGQDETSSD